MIGVRVNNYVIVEQIGLGGMGIVYRAEHAVMKQRSAAIKVLSPEFATDGELVDRFVNEARAAGAIMHPNIVSVIDVGVLPEQRLPYLMMEYLHGETVGERLARRRSLPAREAIDIARQTTLALAATHAAGIVHRDLKPDNLFLVADSTLPSGERVKVLDFGIAKLLPEVGGVDVHTRTGQALGTPHYMSPEQCRGLTHLVDGRADVYALGTILYEMLCGRPPFLGAGSLEVMTAQVSLSPDPPRALNPTIPRSLEAIVLRALGKQPDQRFPSVDEMAHALDLVARELESPVRDERRFRRRWIAVGLLAAVGGAAAAVLVSRDQAPPVPREGPRPPSRERQAFPSAAPAKPTPARDAGTTTAVRVPASPPAAPARPIARRVRPAQRSATFDAGARLPAAAPATGGKLDARPGTIKW